MAVHFKYDCPHCLTRSAGFLMVQQWLDRERPPICNAVAVCGVCNNGLLLKSFDKAASSHFSLLQNDFDYPSDRFVILDTWPKYRSESPKNVPANVVRFYEQGMENLQHQRWDAAGAMFRKCLDVATKMIAPEKRAKVLYVRINELVTEGHLTKAMGDWSHEIRLDGNDAVHDEEPETEEDAHITQRFTEAVLTYSFTLPAMVDANRAKRAPPANDAAAGAAA